MKASVLLNILARRIDKHGDLDVVISYDGQMFDSMGVAVVDDIWREESNKFETVFEMDY